jgi:hypothetical protein
MCEARTLEGRRCRIHHDDGHRYCHVHRRSHKKTSTRKYSRRYDEDERPVMTRKRRANKKKCTYKKTLPSPRGYGLCARFERIGTKERGRDGYMWKVVMNDDDKKVWRRQRKYGRI